MIYVITTYILHVIAVGNGFEYGKKLPCEAFLTLNEFGLQQCFIECKAYRLCLSINYNRNHLVCGLNSAKGNSTLLPINDDDFVYNEITDPVRLLIVLSISDLCFNLKSSCLNQISVNQTWNLPRRTCMFWKPYWKIPIAVKEHLICSPVSALRVIKQVRFLFVLIHTVVLCHDV